MRTTLSIDDDVLDAAKAIAARQKRSLGEVISALARGGLRPTQGEVKSGETKNGLPLLPLTAGGGPVTLDMINALRDETF